MSWETILFVTPILLIGYLLTQDALDRLLRRARIAAGADALTTEDEDHRGWRAFFRGCFNVLTYGVLLVLPGYLFFYFLPVLQAVQAAGVTAQDVTIYNQRSSAESTFRDYRLPPPGPERKAFLLAHLPGAKLAGQDAWEAFVAWGRSLPRDPAQPGDEKLTDEDRAVQAALDRLTGKDEFTKKVAALEATFPEERFTGDIVTPRMMFESYAFMAMFLHVFYPNDDIAYLTFGRGWDTGKDGGLGTYDPRTFATLILWFAVMGLIVQRGVRLTTVSLSGRLLLLGKDREFRSYERGAFNSWRQLLGMALVFTATWWLAERYLEPFYVFYLGNERALLAGVVWNVLMGGVLVEGLEHLCAILFLRCGLNPHKMIWDNLLSGVVAVAVLLYFQNNWFSIAASLAMGLVLSGLEKGSYWARRAFFGAGREYDIDREEEFDRQEERNLNPVSGPPAKFGIVRVVTVLGVVFGVVWWWSEPLAGGFFGAFLGWIAGLFLAALVTNTRLLARAWARRRRR